MLMGLSITVGGALVRKALALSVRPLVTLHLQPGSRGGYWWYWCFFSLFFFFSSATTHGMEPPAFPVAFRSSANFPAYTLTDTLEMCLLGGLAIWHPGGGDRRSRSSRPAWDVGDPVSNKE